MSYPTPLGPWYVVQRINYGVGRTGSEDFDIRSIEYYTSVEQDLPTWVKDQKSATIFMSIHSAARVAAAEGAQVRVLTSKEEADEFGRGS